MTTDLTTYAPLATRAGAHPPDVFDEMRDVIHESMLRNPRGLQVEIGPSEIGHPCGRWMAHKLAGTPKVNNTESWRSFVGTAGHAFLAEVFHQANDWQPEHLPTRWFTENRVHAGQILGPDGYEVYGSCDVYDLHTALVVDWKIVSKTTLDDARRHGPRPNYRAQGHAYGRGWIRRGVPVRNVSIAYLPASGELEDAVFWHEPYNEQIVIDALDRVSAISRLVSQVGSAAAAVLPTAEHYCTRCPFFQPRAEDLTVACPGHPDAKRTEPPAVMQQLIA